MKIGCSIRARGRFLASIVVAVQKTVAAVMHRKSAAVAFQ
jgi:hypothetical protein